MKNDENETRLTIDDFRARVKLSDADGYRAAYLGEHCLTAPYHATLSDRDLLAEAEAEALRADIIGPTLATRVERLIVDTWRRRGSSADERSAELDRIVEMVQDLRK